MDAALQSEAHMLPLYMLRIIGGIGGGPGPIGPPMGPPIIGPGP